MSQIVKELYEALVSVGAEREAAGAAAVSVAPGRDVAEMKETLAAIQTELPATVRPAEAPNRGNDGGGGRHRDQADGPDR